MNLVAQEILKHIKAENTQNENEILEELSIGYSHTSELIPKVRINKY